MRVVVVGHNVRNVAESARKAGWEVFALTKYVDADLKLYAEAKKLEDTKDLAEIVDSIAESLNAYVVLTSGCEDLPVKSEVLGVAPKVAGRILDKLRFYRTLERAGIPFPELVDEPPCIIKPRRGGGGLNVKFLRKGEVPDGFIAQRFIDGIPCSVSLIAGERYVRPIAVNEILVGWRMLNAKDFIYCGNITPLKVDHKRLIELAVEVVELFDLIGSVGVDFVLAEEPYVLEINPRFQGSLDSIEWSTDANIFSMHVKACFGKTVEAPKPKRFASRAVLFSPKDLTVKTSLTGNPFFADIPNLGEIVREGEPLISILASGRSREELLCKINESIRSLRSLLGF